MIKMVGLKEASATTGLSEWELKRGIQNGDYPYVRVGEGKGKFLFDIELLSETIRNRAIANMHENQPVETLQFGIRKVRD